MFISDRVQVSALVLGAVAGVAESFLAAGVLAQVRLLPRVAPQVDLQVLQTRKRFVAVLKLQKRQACRLQTLGRECVHAERSRH